MAQRRVSWGSCPTQLDHPLTAVDLAHLDLDVDWTVPDGLDPQAQRYARATARRERSPIRRWRRAFRRSTAGGLADP